MKVRFVTYYTLICVSYWENYIRLMSIQLFFTETMARFHNHLELGLIYDESAFLGDILRLRFSLFYKRTVSQLE